MLLLILILMSMATQAIQSSKIIKRDLYQSLKLEPTSHPVFNFKQSLRYPIHPTAQTPTSYGFQTGHENGWSRIKVAKLVKPLSSYSNNYPNEYYHLNKPTFNTPYSGVHPDFSLLPKLFGPSSQNQNNGPSHNDHEDGDDGLGGGVPDFKYLTTGGVSGPQPEVDYIPHHVLNMPLEFFGVPQDHRLKQGYSPVHYRYNDDDYAPIGVECNRYHCPL